MKSKLRSRWYRPNEKPLESNSGNQKNTEPFGEIDTSGLKIEDDLSKISIQVRQNSQNDSKRNNSQSENTKRTSPKNRSRRKSEHSKGPSHASSKNDDKSEFSTETKDNSKNKDYKPRKKRRRKSYDPNKKNHSNKNGRKELSKKPEKKSGISGFLSKIFGG
ncbi:MAG: hypothetical protein ACJ0E8_02550 [Gammaproteobacteria bacterium]